MYLNSKNLTHSEIKEKILELENLFPVDTWVVNGIFIWPYIRIKLYFLLLTDGKTDVEEKKSSSDNRNNDANSIFKKIKLPFEILISYVELKIFFGKLKQKDILFFGSHIHRVKHTNGYFNRFFDSIVSYHNLQDKVYMVEYQKIFQSNYNNKSVLKLEKNLKSYKLLIKISSKFKTKKTNFFLNKYDSFLYKLNSEDINTGTLNISEKDLIRWSQKIISIECFFKKMFVKINPSKVVFAGYYGLDNLYAAVLAANNLSIKTIDFQHGLQTNMHMVFTLWSKIPSQGFNIMPTEYWTWDEYSKDNIDVWAKKTSNVAAKVVGQPYLQYWRLRSKQTSKEKQVILYSLQIFDLKEMLSQAIISLINNSEYLWVIRLHPRNEFSVLDIENHIQSFGTNKNNYTIDDSKEIPLPEVLINTFLHVTAFSGCIIEAKMMGIPSLIMFSVGAEIFKDYIDNKSVYYLDHKNNNFEIDFFTLCDSLKNTNHDFLEKEIVNPLSI